MPESRRLRRRFWIEAGLATVTGLLAIITLISREWIEMVFGIDPDNGSGALEWAIVGVLALVCVVLAATARWEWSRVMASPSAG